MVETVIGIVAGFVLSVGITRYYYRLSVRHRLAVYGLQAFQVMSDLDPVLEMGFSVEFNETPVENLTVMELLIVNEGSHPIRDCVEPLSIQLPDSVRLLGVTIPYINPEGREVSVEAEPKNRLRYPFNLLNPGEYFLTKVVVDGYVHLEELSITIAADNLPPRLKPKPGARVTTRKQAPIVRLITVLGVVLYALVGLYAVSLLSLLRRMRPDPMPAWLHLPLLYPATVVAGITSAVVIISAMGFLAFLISTFLGGTTPPARRFPVPETIRGRDESINIGFGIELWRDLRDHPGKSD